MAYLSLSEFGEILISFCIIFCLFSSQFMVVTRSGPPGLSVVNHAEGELSIALVHAPIPRQQIKDKTAGDWGNTKKCEYVTHMDVQI